MGSAITDSLADFTPRVVIHLRPAFGLGDQVAPLRGIHLGISL
jgi:hypothetical protein